MCTPVIKNKQYGHIDAEYGGVNNIGLFFTIILLLLIFVVTSIFMVPVFFRYQARESASNQVSINEIMIKQQDQLIEVERKKAEIRIEEAKGIASSQNIINATLTDRYLQHEAIKAQERLANSPNHTQIYIPTGALGIPVTKILP